VDLQTASIREFSRIAGVDPSAVSRAAKAGKRLTSKSVSRDSNGDPRITILYGCYEWLQYKDERREKKTGSTSSVPGIMSREAAGDIDRHYSALMKQLEFGKACGELLPLSKFNQQAGECLRACRDTLTNLPLVLSELSRPLMLRLMRIDGQEVGPDIQKQMDDAVLQLRVTAKREVRKALNQAADMLEDQIARDHEKKKVDESLNDA
jgi:hypothetical protein